MKAFFSCFSFFSCESTSVHEKSSRLALLDKIVLLLVGGAPGAAARRAAADVAVNLAVDVAGRTARENEPEQTRAAAAAYRLVATGSRAILGDLALQAKVGKQAADAPSRR